MNDIAEIIIATATLVSAIGALILGIMNRTKIEQVHLATNSKMDRLLTTVGESEKAKGVIEGEARATGKPAGHIAAADVAITAETVSVERKR